MIRHDFATFARGVSNKVVEVRMKVESHFMAANKLFARIQQLRWAKHLLYDLFGRLNSAIVV